MRQLIFTFIAATIGLWSSATVLANTTGDFSIATVNGGRGGQIVYVTNRDCAGPGSLNDALAMSGAKYIMFKVSGRIDCTVEILRGEVYMAGQTSPQGVSVRGIVTEDRSGRPGKARHILIRDLHARQAASTVEEESYTAISSPDRDSDGMPDEWELSQGLNPDVDDHNGHEIALTKTGAAGYTNLDYYLDTLADGMATPQAAAAMAPALFTSLQVTKNGKGTVTSTPTGILCGNSCFANYPLGTVVTLTATPDSGSNFLGWNDNNCGKTPTCKLTVNSLALRNITANFQPAPTLTIVKSGAGNGTVVSLPVGIYCGTQCTTNFQSSQQVTLFPLPAQGSLFFKWNGACTGSGSCLISMDAAKSVTAVFKKK